ncbi:MAG: hypothetical protein PVTTEEND_001485, partial [Candidatus Fervidibacter sp.]
MCRWTLLLLVGLLSLLPAKDGFKVALITPGPISDGGWNQSAYLGLQRLRKELGAQIAHTEVRSPAEYAEAFRDELKYLLLHQYGAFNSPVWFNLGIEPRAQASACFIVSVDDTMESILELAKTEGMIFKFGSGSGSNLSRLRSSQEYLSGGGRASGPVSFMRGFDAFAGVIKSGGKT